MNASPSAPASTRRLFQNILDVDQPIVAAINGDAVGLGATLALFSDVTVIADSAKFGDSHVKVGLVAGDGGAVVWPLLVGPSRAKEFLMRGRLVSGSEAHALGLVNHAVPAAEVAERASSTAQWGKGRRLRGGSEQSKQRRAAGRGARTDSGERGGAAQNGQRQRSGNSECER